MILYGSTRSPYVVKVRIAIAEKGVECQFEACGAGAPEVMAANPLAKVPTLVREDGTGVYDSSVIVEYVDSLAPLPKLIPDAPKARIEVKRWEALGDGMIDALVAIMHDARLPAAQQQGETYVAKYRRKIDSGLAAMDRELGAQAFCFGESLTLADIACGSTIRYLERVLPENDWRGTYPGLARHVGGLFERESFQIE